jgi:nucleoside-diphosphate-sugar epimerase
MVWEKVLVTGASGFKGGWLCKALLELGTQVYATIPIHNVRHPHSAYQLFDLSQDVVEVSLDISDSQLVFDVINAVGQILFFTSLPKRRCRLLSTILDEHSWSIRWVRLTYWKLVGS